MTGYCESKYSNSNYHKFLEVLGNVKSFGGSVELKKSKDSETKSKTPETKSKTPETKSKTPETKSKSPGTKTKASTSIKHASKKLSSGHKPRTLENSPKIPNHTESPTLSHSKGDEKSHIYCPIKYITNVEMEAIPSYGVIYVYIDENNDPNYLCIQGDTPEYTSLIRGNYRLSHLYIMFTLMTPSERERIKKYPHEILWEDIQFSPKTLSPRSESYKSYAKEKFSKIEPYIEKFLRYSKSKVKCPEATFPKGRLNDGESEIDCAKREFDEELSHMSLENCKDIGIEPISEKYRGSNGKLYSTKYFVLVDTSKNRPVPTYKTFSGKIRDTAISQEARTAFWVSVASNFHGNPEKGIDPTIKHIDKTPLNPRRKKILLNLDKEIRRWMRKSKTPETKSKSPETKSKSYKVRSKEQILSICPYREEIISSSYDALKKSKS